MTRLRLRSARFLPGFAFYTLLSRRQAQNAPGCRDVRVRKTLGLTFWTLTAWSEEAAMRAFALRGSHRLAMRHLNDWCDEAAVGHWQHDDDSLPSWSDAALRLRTAGRKSLVRFPSERQQRGELACD